MNICKKQGMEQLEKNCDFNDLVWCPEMRQFARKAFNIGLLQVSNSARFFAPKSLD